MAHGLHVLRRYWAEAYTAFFGIVGVIDAMAHPIAYEGVDKGPDWVVWLTPAAVAAPLLFRRRFPFGAPACSVVVAVVASFVATGEAVTDGMGAIFIIAAAAWLFGELDTRSAGLGLLLVYAAAPVINLNSSDVAWGDYVFPAVLFTIFWAASRALAVRGQRLRDAEARAHHLAAERDAESLKAVAEERQRIARELHDVIAHSVSVMTVQAGAVRRLLQPEQEGSGDGQGTGGGHGLAGMRERVFLYGGEISSGTRDGGGYVVRAGLPVTQA